MKLLFAVLAAITPLATAHSWIEEYQVIGPNGSYVGDHGYSRGYVSRTEPGYNGYSMEYIVPALDARTAIGTVRLRLNASDNVCHPAQRTANYSAQYPMLQVTPGSYVAMKYLENGHVTLPWNITGKPMGSGTVYVFGTTKPSAEEAMVDVMAWNQAGTGGDGRGFLMTAQQFDDGRCHQINCGNISLARQMLEPDHVAGQPTSSVEQWCETDVLIPSNTAPGILTTYWIWQWPTSPNMNCDIPDGKDEYYTTCADFQVLPANSSAAIDNKLAVHTLAQENPQTAAITDYASRTAIYTPVPSIVQMAPDNKEVNANATATASPDFLSSCTFSRQYSVTTWPAVYVPNTCSAVVSTFGAQAASAALSSFEMAASSYSSGSSSAVSSALSSASAAAAQAQATATSISLTTAATSLSAGVSSSMSSVGTTSPLTSSSSSSPTSTLTSTTTVMTTLISTITTSTSTNSLSSSSVTLEDGSSFTTSTSPSTDSSATASAISLTGVVLSSSSFVSSASSIISLSSSIMTLGDSLLASSASFSSLNALAIASSLSDSIVSYSPTTSASTTSPSSSIITIGDSSSVSSASFSSLNPLAIASSLSDSIVSYSTTTSATTSSSDVTSSTIIAYSPTSAITSSSISAALLTSMSALSSTSIIIPSPTTSAADSSITSMTAASSVTYSSVDQLLSQSVNSPQVLVITTVFTLTISPTSTALSPASSSSAGIIARHIPVHVVHGHNHAL